MKTLLISLCFSFGFLFQAFSQSYEWVYDEPVDYMMNYELPLHLIKVSDNGTVYTSTTSHGALYYSPFLLGTSTLEAHDANSQLLWSRDLGNMMLITHLTTDHNGNVYAMGKFMDSLVVASDTILYNTGTGFNLNIFMISYDENGSFRWIKNLTPSLAPDGTIEALNCDAQDNIWYVFQDWMTSNFHRIDSNDNDSLMFTFEGTRTIGSIDFDEQGNLFVAGSTQMGTLVVPGNTLTVPESYMMFVARIKSSGQTSWVRLAHDVTFQYPVVVAGKDGHAWLAGSIMDSTTWGNVHFHGSQWVYDIFLTRVDSMGNFSLAIQPPLTPTITGDFERGRNLCLANDSQDNVYLTGFTRGIIDWGNGVFTGGGQPPNREISFLSFDPSGTARWAMGGAMDAAANTFNVDITPDGECYFASAVIGMAFFGCFTLNSNGGQAAVFGKISSTLSTAIPQMTNKGDLHLWPNPAKDQISIQLQEPGTASLQIRDISSRLMLQQEVTNEATLDVSNFSPGVYFYSLSSQQGKKYSGYFIKE